MDAIRSKTLFRIADGWPWREGDFRAMRDSTETSQKSAHAFTPTDRSPLNLKAVAPDQSKNEQPVRTSTIQSVHVL